MAFAGVETNQEESDPVGDGWVFFFALAGLVVNGAGLGFVAFQVMLARGQLRTAQVSEEFELLRRRRQATADAYNATQHYRGSLRESLPDDWNDEEVKLFLKRVRDGGVREATILHDYLGHLETFSVAVSAGIYDLEVLDSLCGPRLITVMNNYRSYIRTRRKIIGYNGYCAELEWLADKLQERRLSGPPYIPLAKRPRRLALEP